MVLFIIGLPIVLATAFVQEGVPMGSGATAGPAINTESPKAAEAAATSVESTPDEAVARGGSARERGAAEVPSHTQAIRRVLSWRNVLLAGLVVFAV